MNPIQARYQTALHPVRTEPPQVSLFIIRPFPEKVKQFFGFFQTFSYGRHTVPFGRKTPYSLSFLEPKRYSVPFFSRLMLALCSQMTMSAMIRLQAVLKTMVGRLAPIRTQ